MSLSSSRPWGKQRRHLAALACQLRQALQQQGLATGGDTNIIPLIIGGDQETVELAAKLQEHGFLIFPVRPPAVPEGTARFRLSLTADMTWPDLQGLPELLARELAACSAGRAEGCQMKSEWLHQAPAGELIIFCNGWGMDATPFQPLGARDYDVLMLFDYYDLSLDCDLETLFQKLSGYSPHLLVHGGVGRTADIPALVASPAEGDCRQRHPLSHP